jgi:hypothetical protein
MACRSGNAHSRDGAVAGHQQAGQRRAGLIFAFFAVNATQIHKNLSMFSSYYLPVYLAVFSLFVVGGLLLLVLYLRFRREFRAIARSGRTSWISPDICIGEKTREPAPEALRGHRQPARRL